MRRCSNLLGPRKTPPKAFSDGRLGAPVYQLAAALGGRLVALSVSRSLRLKRPDVVDALDWAALHRGRKLHHLFKEIDEISGAVGPHHRGVDLIGP